MAPLCKVFSYLCGRGDADSLREILTPVFSLYEVEPSPSDLRSDTSPRGGGFKVCTNLMIGL